MITYSNAETCVIFHFHFCMYSSTDAMVGYSCLLTPVEIFFCSFFNEVCVNCHMAYKSMSSFLTSTLIQFNYRNHRKCSLCGRLHLYVEGSVSLP